MWNSQYRCLCLCYFRPCQCKADHWVATYERHGWSVKCGVDMGGPETATLAFGTGHPLVSHTKVERPSWMHSLEATCGLSCMNYHPVCIELPVDEHIVRRSLTF